MYSNHALKEEVTVWR